MSIRTLDSCHHRLVLVTKSSGFADWVPRWLPLWPVSGQSVAFLGFPFPKGTSNFSWMLCSAGVTKRETLKQAWFCLFKRWFHEEDL